MQNLYVRLDALLAPSIWPESYGVVAREVLQCGLWVVASDPGAISEDVIEGENGFVVDVSSSWDLRRVLTEIDRDPSRLKRDLALTPKLHTVAAQVGELARSIVRYASSAYDPWSPVSRWH